MADRRRWLVGLAALSLAALGAFYLGWPHEVYRIPSAPQSLQQISFYALGDQGGGSRHQKQVAQAMETLASEDGKLDFVALLGDNFYETHAMAVDSPEWESSFENIYLGAYLSRVPFYAVLGNNDYDHAVISARYPEHVQIAHALQGRGSNRWRMPARYYHVDFGEVGQRVLLRVVFVDTNLSGEELDRQADYIRQQFLSEKGDPVWKMVVGHHTVKSFGKHYGETCEATQAVRQAMQEAKVDVYVSGHDHNQQLIADEGEPLYVVSGAGGHGIYRQKQSGKSLRFFRADFGFVRFRVDARQLDFDFVDTRAHAVASYTIERACTIGASACLKASGNGKGK